MVRLAHIVQHIVNTVLRCDLQLTGYVVLDKFGKKFAVFYLPSGNQSEYRIERKPFLHPVRL
jgi:hypothetical protein